MTWAYQPPPSVEEVTAVVTSVGGLHHIEVGIGDPGVGVVPQTLHTIELGISA